MSTLSVDTELLGAAVSCTWVLSTRESAPAAVKPTPSRIMRAALETAAMTEDPVVLAVDLAVQAQDQRQAVGPDHVLEQVVDGR